MITITRTHTFGPHITHICAFASLLGICKAQLLDFIHIKECSSRDTSGTKYTRIARFSKGG